MMMTIGAAKAIGRFITRLTSLPQKPFSTSSRVLVFCTRAPSQCSHQLVGFQLRKNGTRRNVYTPRESTFGPSSARKAGSTVIDRIAASMTEAIMAYVSDLRKPCGNSNKPANGCRDQHRRERDGAPGRHHGAADRGFGVVALSDLLAEAADHEQPVVDGDAETDQRDHRLREVVHRHRKSPINRMMPSAPAMVSPPMIARQECRDHTAEHEEEHDHHQRHGEHFGPLLVLGDGPRQLVGQRLQTGQFHVDARDVEVVLDQLCSS